MSKEQTPITAEEFLDAKGFSMDDFRSEQRYLLIRDLMEQYAQVKVLEALEREFNHKDCINVNKSFFNSDGELDILSASEYYKTEVKQKYER